MEHIDIRRYGIPLLRHRSPAWARLLAHPEKDFHAVGMKSYGRAPTFLLATGYEQVRSVVAALAGDREAADAPEPVLIGFPTGRPIMRP